MSRLAISIVGCLSVGLCLSACSGSESDDGAAFLRPALTNPSDVTIQASADSRDLAREWVVTASSGLGDYDEANARAQLTFSEIVGDHARLTVTGCSNFSAAVTLQPDNRLAVDRPVEQSICASPFDVGQAVPSFLAAPVSWSIVGDELTLTSAERGATLTLNATG